MQVSPLHHLRRNAVAYLALFVALGGTSFAAATVITGKNVKDSSLTGADVKKGSLTGSDVKNKSLAPADFNGSVPRAEGDIGPQGPKGDNGTNGTNGTNATINGVAAGGDLTAAIRTRASPTSDHHRQARARHPGSHNRERRPRPRLRQQRGQIGPFSGPVRLLVDCAGPSVQSNSLGMRIIAQRPGHRVPGRSTAATCAARTPSSGSTTVCYPTAPLPTTITWSTPRRTSVAPVTTPASAASSSAGRTRPSRAPSATSPTPPTASYWQPCN